MAQMHPQRIEKHPSNPNLLLSMASFYHILPPFSYLIKLNKCNILDLCYATSEYEVWTIPSLEEMPLSCSTINKLSLNTWFFIRCDRFIIPPNDNISIGWHKRTKHYVSRYESPPTKSPSGLPKHKTSENTYTYKTSQITYLDLFYIMNRFHTVSFSHILREFKFPKPFWN